MALLALCLLLILLLFAALMLQSHRSRPVRLALFLPTITTHGGEMADIPLANDLIYTIPIVTEDAAGNVVPPPTGDTFSAVSSDPSSLGCVIGAVASGAPAVVLTPLKQAATGVTVTVTDSAGLTQDVATFDIGPGTATMIALDFKDETTQSQAVPPS